MPAVGALLALVGGAGGGLLRSRLRHRLSRPAALEAGGGRRVEIDRWSLAAMAVLAALCVLAGVLPGLCDRRASRRSSTRSSARECRRNPACHGCRSCPIAESRSSYNGLLVFLFIAASALARRLRHPSLRLEAPAPRARLGLRLSGRRARRRNIRPDSFAQPIRRVFGAFVFRAREHVDMPAPGDMRPARFKLELHDLAWEFIYTPIARAVSFAAERLNRLQFLTIRRLSQPRLRRSRRSCCWLLAVWP